MDANERQPRSPYSGKPVAGDLEPFDLYSSDGDKVGTVVEVNDEFLVVQHGGFLGLGESHGRVPRHFVARTEDDGWYLSLDQDGAKQILEGEGLYTPTEATANDATSPGATGAHDVETDTVTTHEEELQAQKTPRQAGEVSVRKEVVEETETIEVPVTREEVHVERRPASGQATTGEATIEDEEVRIPVMEEEIEVRKVARPVEEVTITKEEVRDTEQVSGTVRKERVEVEDEIER